MIAIKVDLAEGQVSIDIEAGVKDALAEFAIIQNMITKGLAEVVAESKENESENK